MRADSTDEHNVAELRAFFWRKNHVDKALEELLAERLVDQFVTICFRCAPGAFICEIADGAITWVGSGRTMREAFDSANSRTVSK